MVKGAYKILGARFGHEVVFKEEFFKYDLYKFWSEFVDWVSGIVSGLIFGIYESCGSTLKTVWANKQTKKNCHRPQKTKKWLLNAMWYPGWDLGTKQGY